MDTREAIRHILRMYEPSELEDALVEWAENDARQTHNLAIEDAATWVDGLPYRRDFAERCLQVSRMVAIVEAIRSRKIDA